MIPLPATTQPPNRPRQRVAAQPFVNPCNTVLKHDEHDDENPHSEQLDTATNEPATSFADVPHDATYSEAVTWLKNAGIIKGKTRTTFDPDSPVTRIQLALMLWSSMGCPESNVNLIFADIKPADIKRSLSSKAASWMVINDIFSGCDAIDPKLFCPYQPLTEAQLAYILWRFAGSPDVHVSSDKG